MNGVGSGRVRKMGTNIECNEQRCIYQFDDECTRGEIELKSNCYGFNEIVECASMQIDNDDGGNS
jgi:hypothetical protein